MDTWLSNRMLGHVGLCGGVMQNFLEVIKLPAKMLMWLMENAKVLNCRRSAQAAGQFWSM